MQNRPNKYIHPDNIHPDYKDRAEPNRVPPAQDKTTYPMPTRSVDPDEAGETGY